MCLVFWHLPLFIVIENMERRFRNTLITVVVVVFVVIVIIIIIIIIIIMLMMLMITMMMMMMMMIMMMVISEIENDVRPYAAAIVMLTMVWVKSHNAGLEDLRYKVSYRILFNSFAKVCQMT